MIRCAGGSTAYLYQCNGRVRLRAGDPRDIPLAMPTIRLNKIEL